MNIQPDNTPGREDNSGADAWKEASLHDAYPPQWPEPAVPLESDAERHQHELSLYRASVFSPPEVPIEDADHNKLLQIAERSRFQHDEVLLSGRDLDEETAAKITERIFEKAMVVSQGAPWTPDGIDAQSREDNLEVYRILSTPEMSKFLLSHYQSLQQARGEEIVPGRMELWESQFTRMGYTGRFQFIGKHDHSDVGDLVTVNLLKVVLDWGDHNKHGHVIEVQDDSGNFSELRVPAVSGDFIVEGSEVQHRVPKLKDRESRRISLASVWRFVPEESSIV